jgi:hypothetical protein
MNKIALTLYFTNVNICLSGYRPHRSQGGRAGSFDISKGKGKVVKIRRCPATVIGTKATKSQPAAISPGVSLPEALVAEKPKRRS